jgi:hypothetical protein
MTATTAPPVVTYTEPLAVDFVPPLQNPAPGGLYPNVVWQEVAADEPSRHLMGVAIRPAGNFGGDQATGVWNAPWCGDPTPGQLKEGERPDGLDPFEPVTVWAADECDLTEPSRAEVQARAQQLLRMRESVMVAREFAARLLVDAADLPGPVPTADDPVAALALLEGELAEANVLGFIHLSPAWLPVLASAQLIARSGLRWVTPGGHALVLDGGYVEGLQQTIVATSQPFGWRDTVQVRTAIDERHNLFIAIAERSVTVGYEAVVAAVEIVP